MNELVKVYNDGSVELRVEFRMIDGQVYAKANSMADSQKLADWKRSANTKRYLEALKSRKINGMENSHSSYIISESGTDTLNGTWIHEKLILNLARYISVDFEIWADEQIATLIREGEVSLAKPSYTIDNPIERAKRWIEEQELHQLEIKEKDTKIEQQQVKIAEVKDTVNKITEGVDVALLAKTTTDYVKKLAIRSGKKYGVVYNDIYGLLGRRLNMDINVRHSNFCNTEEKKAIDNLKYNIENNLTGEDRIRPFRKSDTRYKISKLEYIVDILGKGMELFEVIAKLAEVKVDDVIGKYKLYEEEAK